MYDQGKMEAEKAEASLGAWVGTATRAAAPGEDQAEVKARGEAGAQEGRDSLLAEGVK